MIKSNSVYNVCKTNLMRKRLVLNLFNSSALCKSKSECMSDLDLWVRTMSVGCRARKLPVTCVFPSAWRTGFDTGPFRQDSLCGEGLCSRCCHLDSVAWWTLIFCKQEFLLLLPCSVPFCHVNKVADPF